jgi:mannose/fructose/N-acetylgalactosamine-specific phosphotransferase system component IIC
VDSLEKIAYTLLGFVCVVYLGVMLVGLIAAWPWGIVGLIAIAAIGLLLIKVVSERLANDEDTYYSKNVDK